MKNFLISLIATVIFILPNFAQADALEDFKNILASKHFFIKYTYQRDGDYYNTAGGKGAFVKNKDNAQIMNAQNFNTPHIAIEAYDGNNFYTEDGVQHKGDSSKNKMSDMLSKIPTICHLKIDDKLFMLTKIEKTGKSLYRNGKIAYYQEVDEDFDFLKTQKVTLPIGTVESYKYQTALSSAIIALFNKENDIYSGKYLYRRAGSGTTEDGLEYFDFKCEVGNGNVLNAIRYSFKDGVIKQISMAMYSKDPQSGEVSGHKTIIDVEEFNTNPAPNYFQLPKNFKKIEKSPAFEGMMLGNA